MWATTRVAPTNIIQYMYYIILFISLLLLINCYFKIADYFNIIDKPNNRSSHTEITIRGGGIIFTIGAVIYFVSSGFQFPWFMLGLLLITIVSFVDDIKPASRGIRISVNLVAVMLMLFQLSYNNVIPSGFFGDGLFNVSTIISSLRDYWFIGLAALIVAIGIINAYNFMDGINGITGGYSLAVLAGLWLAGGEACHCIDGV